MSLTLLDLRLFLWTNFNCRKSFVSKYSSNRNSEQLWYKLCCIVSEISFDMKLCSVRESILSSGLEVGGSVCPLSSNF